MRPSGSAALRHLIAIALFSALVTALASFTRAADGPWESLAPGLDLGRFSVSSGRPGEESEIVILRVDPEAWELRICCASEEDSAVNYTAREWCERRGLVAAINAGMFDIDYLTHVGYMRSGEHLNNPRVNEYQSVAAFKPKLPGLSPFRIFDLDEPGVTLERIGREYADAVQNLRLVKRPGVNRWAQQPRKWSEAALGEDASGRPLLILSRAPFSMHDLNEILLGFPIDLVCAQHLEGGPEAQLYVGIGGTSLEILGGYETGFFEKGWIETAWRIPFVIGIAPRGAGIQGSR